MTLKLTIENTAGNPARCIRVKRGTEQIAELKPGERAEVYVWAGSDLTIHEPAQQHAPAPEADAAPDTAPAGSPHEGDR